MSMHDLIRQLKDSNTTGTVMLAADGLGGLPKALSFTGGNAEQREFHELRWLMLGSVAVANSPWQSVE
jgi:hypothetical protein